MSQNQSVEKYPFDAYAPKEIALIVEKAGVAKANLDFWSMLVLAVLGGVFVALGSELFIFVTHDSKLSFGISNFLGGLAYSLGTILIVIAGAELFNSNNLIIMAYMDRKVSLVELLRCWSIVFLGNFLGALSVVVWVYLAEQWSFNQFLLGAKSLLIALDKVDHTFPQAFAQGAICNALVCLAMWLSYGGHSVTDKILSVILPTTAFVTLGYEHTVANMYFIPLGLILKNHPEVIQAATKIAEGTFQVTELTLKNYLLRNMFPVTLGNIFGGSVLVGVVYWFIYLRKNHIKLRENGG